MGPGNVGIVRGHGIGSEPGVARVQLPEGV